MLVMLVSVVGKGGREEGKEDELGGERLRGGERGAGG